MGIESENIYQLRPVSFRYNEDPEKRKTYGLIAEEVDQVMPILTKTDPYGKGELYTVDYDLLPVLLLNELQKMNKRVTELQEKDLTIEDLRAENQAMKKIIDKLLIQMDFVLKKLSVQ
jgi:hypothetical protein